MQERFEVKDGGMYFGARRLGPVDGLYVDTGELPSLKEGDGVRRMQMPRRVDFVFAAGEKTVGGESKKPSDLISSTWSGRLARQIRVLHETVDVSVLLLKGGVPSFDDADAATTIINLVRLECLGVLLLPCPSRDKDVLLRLVEYRKLLVPESRAAFAAVAWTDEGRTKRDNGSGGLLRAIKGVGASRAAALHKYFGSTAAVLMATEQELREAGVSAKLAKRIREVAE